jgi:hypothetical protein
LVGPFKKPMGRFTHIFVAVDKFTKWVKAKPAASITAVKAVEFYKEIMYKFGIPNNIISDNGTQFTAGDDGTHKMSISCANILSECMK